MKIKNHLLFGNDDKQVSFRQTPNKSGRYTPQYLVMHYTAVTTTDSTLNWFVNPSARASAHLLVCQDGTVHQFAPFNLMCWHAGESSWNGKSGLNSCSIGIELVNGGRLSKKGNQYICPVDKRPVDESEVLMATHKNEVEECAWQEYTDVQIEASLEIAALLVKTYGLQDVLGHDDISPIRKSDPGPAFPMESFRSRALGREDQSLDEYKTSAALNIRSGPGTDFPTIAEPLPPGTNVLMLKREGNWSFVEVLDVVNGQMDLEGWVFTKYLVK